MDPENFSKHLVELRMKKGVSARDMSLSLVQSARYINNIENGINFPSMTIFFYICEYFGITPMEFFDINMQDPPKINELTQTASRLSMLIRFLLCEPKQQMYVPVFSQAEVQLQRRNEPHKNR